MPTAYAMRDLAPSDDGRVAAGHVRVPEHRGGCGAEHEVKVNDRGHAYIDCDRCGPALVGSHYGWAATPGAVPLTPDEIAQSELAKRDAEAGQNQLMRAMTESFVKAIQSGQAFPGSAPPPQPKSIVEQIAEMSAEDKAALAAMLAPPPAVVEIAPGVRAEATAPDPAPSTTSRVATSSAPVKRGPGRPPKTAR